jgi:hypothetical protein
MNAKESAVLDEEGREWIRRALAAFRRDVLKMRPKEASREEPSAPVNR